ncbi:MAG: hypothetical protein JNN28_09805 [Saprospiraceae bacterium]|nr:hypothetical protein [Saprospiraceae bacterium]
MENCFLIDINSPNSFISEKVLDETTNVSFLPPDAKFKGKLSTKLIAPIIMLKGMNMHQFQMILRWTKKPSKIHYIRIFMNAKVISGEPNGILFNLTYCPISKLISLSHIKYSKKIEASFISKIDTLSFSHEGYLTIDIIIKNENFIISFYQRDIVKISGIFKFPFNEKICIAMDNCDDLQIEKMRRRKITHSKFIELKNAFRK